LETDLRPEAQEEAMSDPRYTDPRYSDPRLSDPVLRRDETVGGMWGWIAGLSVLALIAFILVASWTSDHNSAMNNNPSAPITTGSAPMRSPSTTGSGLMSPQPVTPALAPANRPLQ
jgi:hypothetical protein